MKEKFQKIWVDPVWSKVIAAAIIAICAVLWAFISAKINNVDFMTAWNNFWTFEIPLWVVTVGVFSIILLLGFRQVLNKESFEYDDETLKLDRQVFDRIRTELLPQSGTIQFLRHNNFAGFSFKTDDIVDLHRFEEESNNSNLEFLNPDLEKIKLELLSSVSHFTALIAIQTFPTKNGRQIVPPEWEIDQPERFREVVTDLHDTKFEICEKYDMLIKLGRRVLKI